MREKNKQTIATSSKSFFENGMRGHSAVSSITNLGNDQYLIKRTGNRPDIKIIVADIYIYCWRSRSTRNKPKSI
jgi:hypothetical protein